MTEEELKVILSKHEKWLVGEEGGERAYLHEKDLRGAILIGANLCDANLCDANLDGANLCDANLDGANLCDANLDGAILCDANLRGANLHKVNLRSANLCDANLCDANLCDANLSGSFLCGADLRRSFLCGANLCGADLSRADLRRADICGANLREAKNIHFIPMTCPDQGEFIGWKRCKDDRIVKLLIPEDAKRTSATGRKCRCSKAKVLEITDTKGLVHYDSAVSLWDPTFIYTVGDIVSSVEKFDESRFKECASGVHFFINRQEAVEYIM